MMDRLLGYITAALAVGVTLWALGNWWTTFVGHI